jgi:pimeloyl-ACP methyl ester carboxylesterase
MQSSLSRQPIPRWSALALTLAPSLALVACGTSNGASSDAGNISEAAAIGTPPGPPAACPVVVSASECDTSLRPIVFVHGTYSSGTDIEHMAALLGSNGYCQDHIVAIDYDSVALSGAIGSGIDSPGADCTAPNTPAGCGMIDAAITAILQKFPQFTQVDLMGHSQGTFHCGTYLANHADRVAHYINFSGVPDVGNVQTLSLSSYRDLSDCPHHAVGASICAFAQTADGGTEPVAPVYPPPGAGLTCSVPAEGGAPAEAADAGTADGGLDDGGPGCNVIQYTLVHQDHFAVAASKDSFVQVYKYLTGKDPQYTEIQCGDDPVTVEGIAETFADNVPQQGTIEIRAVGSTPRDTSSPAMVITPDGTGHFGPIQLTRNVEYSFTGHAPDGGLVGYEYFTPFKRDNRLIRVLSPSSASDGSPVGGIVADVTFAKTVTSPTTVVAIPRWAQGGFRQDLGASLTVNGVEVLDSANSGTQAATTMALQGGVAALWLEDANKNGQTDLGLVYSTTFIAFTDVFIDATKPAFVDLSFTGGSEDPATVAVPLVIDNWPSTQGLIAVMFQ